MAGPFDMAYGIGAGLANVPGAIQQGREERMKLAMNALALQQAQKQQEMEDATNEVMSRDYPAPEQAPVAIQTPADAYRLDVTNPEAGPSMTPEIAQERGIGVAPKTRTIQPMANPNVVAAHKMLLQAEALQKIGNWRVAQQLRDHAISYGEKGIQEVRQAFGQMVAGGQFDQAVSALHGMGIQNVVGITPSEDGITIHNADGTTHDMDEDAITRFVNPNLPPKTAYDVMLRQQALAQKKANDEARLKQGERRLSITEQNNAERIKLGYARIREAALGSGMRESVYKQKVNDARELALAENPNASELQILTRVQEIMSVGRNTPSARLKDKHAMLTSEIKELVAGNNGNIPRPGSKLYEKYNALVSKRDALREEIFHSSDKPTGSPGELGQPVAKDAQGKMVYKSGNDYVYADGTKYVEPKG